MSFRQEFGPQLLSVQKIWDQASHNALTDLIRYKDRWFCSFRESDVHVFGREGHLRILHSSDGITWSPCAYMEEKGIDLRDPKLSITPNGKLMLVCGGTLYRNGTIYESLQSRVSFSEDGRTWSPFQRILQPHEWLWRVSWHRGKAYGAAYSRSDPKDKYKEWHIKLFESDDGVDFRLITQWDIPGYPNETTLRFLKNGQMLALVRRDGRKDNRAWIGISDPPFENWHWKATHQYFGGPNFILTSDDDIWAAGRILINTPYAQLEKTVLAEMDLEDIRPCLVLPSGGDCSYPGMVYHDKVLWLSYYSSHEGFAAIYLARIAI